MTQFDALAEARKIIKYIQETDAIYSDDLFYNDEPFWKLINRAEDDDGFNYEFAYKPEEFPSTLEFLNDYLLRGILEEYGDEPLSSILGLSCDTKISVSPTNGDIPSAIILNPNDVFKLAEAINEN